MILIADSAKSKTDFSKKVLRKLIMYESKLVRVNCVEPTTISPPKYPRKPTINDIEGGIVFHTLLLLLLLFLFFS